MPVDNHIHIVVGCILDAALHNIFQVFFIAVGTVTAVFMGIHGKTHDIYIPLVPELAECILVHVCGEPADAVGTDALKLHRIAVFVHKLGTVHRKGTAYGRCCQVIIRCLCLRILIVFRVNQAFVPAVVLRFAFVVTCVIFRRCALAVFLCRLRFRFRSHLGFCAAVRRQELVCLVKLTVCQYQKYYSDHAEYRSGNDQNQTCFFLHSPVPLLFLHNNTPYCYLL